MLKLLKLLAILLAIPIIGYGTGMAIQHGFNRTLNKNSYKPVDVLRITCTQPAPKDNPLYVRPFFCKDFDDTERLKFWSLIVALGSFLPPGLFWLAGLYSGQSRQRMALVFPPLMRISLLLLAALSLLQGAIVAYATFVWERYLTDQYHLLFPILIGLGTLFVFAVLIKNAFWLRQKAETHVVGRVLTPEQFPKIHRVVQMLAARLGARPPDHIVAGLDPTFFVTSADVRLPEQKEALRGETLFLSLPLCRLLSLQEFTAVLGHELGHFRGQDTAYSLKFAPVYAGIGSTIYAMSDGEETSAHFMAMPVVAILKLMYSIFSRKEAAISRQRELEADQAAMQVSSASALGTALIKVAMFGQLWEVIQQSNIDRLNQGLVTRNLSMAFANTVQYDIDHDQVGIGISELLEVEIPHPTDTHPTIRARLLALTGEEPDFTLADLRLPAENAIMIFDDAQRLEEELTVLEHRMMVGMGIVELPQEDAFTEEQKFDQAVLNAIYALTSALVTADGYIDDQEITVAEGICQQFLPNFQPVDFREYCYHPDQIPDPMEAIRFLADVTTPDGRELIVKMLHTIAIADNEPSDAERRLIDKVETYFASVPA